jgi:glycosyltransferase involved in cell wall biosynthesis
LKVIRVVPVLDFGGVERRLQLTALGFREIDMVDLDVLVLGSGGRISSELESSGTYPTLLNRRVRIPNFKLILNLYRVFRSAKPDIVHTSGAEANFHGLLAARLAGVPKRIGEEIGFPNHDLKWRLIFKGVYYTATAVIAISEAVKTRIVSLGEVKAQKVQVVYNPVELRTSPKRGDWWPNQAEVWQRASNSFVFVTTCRLVPVKNLNTLIQVFASLIDENSDLDLRLWLVGGGPERESLEKLVEELGIKKETFFWGYQAEVRPFLERADVFVQPSFSEGFSISLVEAMLCGLPSIATNQGGPTEIISEGVSGFLIDPHNPKELRAAMLDMINLSTEQRQAIGHSAMEMAKRFSVEYYIQNLLTVYGMGSDYTTS